MRREGSPCKNKMREGIMKIEIDVSEYVSECGLQGGDSKEIFFAPFLHNTRNSRRKSIPIYPLLPFPPSFIARQRDIVILVSIDIFYFIFLNV